MVPVLSTPKHEFWLETLNKHNVCLTYAHSYIPGHAMIGMAIISYQPLN
jgi:hypothetical protein